MSLECGIIQFTNAGSPFDDEPPLCVQEALVWALDMHKNMYHDLILSKATLSEIDSFIKYIL